MDKLKEILPAGQIRTKEPMDRHTTFRVGGPADFYTEPADISELTGVLRLCQEQQIPYFILGNGSNLLVSDSGYRGVMIAMGKAWSEVMVEGSRLHAGAGALLSHTASQALASSLSGLEFAAGIPGSVGGAVVMNAGAYGSEVASVLTEVSVLNRKAEILTLPAEKMDLGYRTSCIPEHGYIVLEAVFELSAGTQEAIRGRMEELSVMRRSKQPLEYPSAGSTFKRPEGYFAGKLIQDAGLRGFCVGGAQVSEKHCGFVINRGNATASDVMKLCRIIRRKVWENSGVSLEMEIKTLGSFD